MQQETTTHLPADLIPLMVANPEFALVARTLDKSSKRHADQALARRPAYISEMIAWQSQIFNRCGKIKKLFKRIIREAKRLLFHDMITFTYRGHTVNLTWSRLSIHNDNSSLTLSVCKSQRPGSAFGSHVMWINDTSKKYEAVYLLGTPEDNIILTITDYVQQPETDPQPALVNLICILGYDNTDNGGVDEATDILYCGLIDDGWLLENGEEYLKGISASATDLESIIAAIKLAPITEYRLWD